MIEFKLRPWKLSDLASLVKYANNYKIARNLRDGFPHPYSEDAGRRFITHAISENPIRIFAIEINNEAAGGIGIHPKDDIHKNNAELGYWLAETYWGQGIMSKAIEQVVDYSFNTFDINRIYACPFGSNIASQKALEKNNFRLEGRFERTLIKFGEYEDELFYAIRKS